MCEVRKISRAEVEKHKSRESCWMIGGNSVYDVTNFMPLHPGGADVILNTAIQMPDIADVMQDGPHSHSANAYILLENYKIGELDDADVANAPQAKFRLVNGIPLHSYKDDKLIDWNKSIFWQVDKLGDKYYEWIHVPTDKPIRFFETELMERLTHTLWWMVPLFWTPITFWFIWMAYSYIESDAGAYMFDEYSLLHPLVPSVLQFQLKVSHLPVSIVFGFLMWTLTEYLIHRFIFHFNPPSNNRWLVRFHFILHGQHHKDPFNKLRLVFPPAAAAPIGYLLLLTYGRFFGWRGTFAIGPGVAIGYVVYDLMHYYLHHGYLYSPFAFVEEYLRDLKTYHMLHHFVESNKGFGISSKLWDFAFQTVIPTTMVHNRLLYKPSTETESTHTNTNGISNGHGVANGNGVANGKGVANGNGIANGKSIKAE